MAVGNDEFLFCQFIQQCPVLQGFCVSVITEVDGWKETACLCCVIYLAFVCMSSSTSQIVHMYASLCGHT